MKKGLLVLLSSFLLIVFCIQNTNALCVNGVCRPVGGGGRLYGTENYYKYYNQLCPAPLGYIPLETIMIMLETQDNSLCEDYNRNTSENENDENTKENLGENTDFNENIDNEDDNKDDKNTSEDYKDKIKKYYNSKGSYVYNNTTPKQGGYYVTCHLPENGGEVYGKITLYSDFGELMTQIGTQKIYDEEGNEVGEEKTDYIYIKPENLHLYIKGEKLEECLNK